MTAAPSIVYLMTAAHQLYIYNWPLYHYRCLPTVKLLASEIS